MMIQKLRLQRGWSQQQLAELAGLSTRTIQRLERGEAASVESLKALAAVFEVDFQSLQPQASVFSEATQESTMSHSPTVTASPNPVNPVLAREMEERWAFRQVRKIRGFYIHLTIYLLVIGANGLMLALREPRFNYVPIMALGWGIGVLFHGLSVFGRSKFFGPAWEKKQVEKILGREL